MEAYLDRRLNVDWRTARQRPPRGPRSDMTREEALAVLGLAEGLASDLAAYITGQVLVVDGGLVI
jgi:NAD(P)-dependent dehydrogenase (short-subunit alcohol dehydrogenase family)